MRTLDQLDKLQNKYSLIGRRGRMERTRTTNIPTTVCFFHQKRPQLISSAFPWVLDLLIRGGTRVIEMHVSCVESR
jgi:hypothetical protein